ncbi:metal-dependent hydrolase [Halorussus salilacus]|uniref:metal-dependent hydrolase n=1 Tax=Halorussus salilacus TaxID=2953750 RepID=UPI00209D4787|nr:metal-dependent hydrolase [Halorussus salilacus]USZ69387.1 metal-dependent hydrolase [Halorussus salilacus]
MVADGIHILLGVAMVMVLLRTDRVEPYLVAMLCGALPDLDRYVFVPFVYRGYLSGTMWTHRGITHSLVALGVVVVLAASIGQWRAAAIAYGSHLLADIVTGSVRLFAPFDLTPYGLHYDWMTGTLVAGVVSSLVVGVGLVSMVSDEYPRTPVEVRRRVLALRRRFLRREQP